jgi:hypothetical protein
MTKPETAAEPHRCPNCGPVEAVDLSAETVRGGRRLDRPATDTALRQRIADAVRPWVLDSGHGAEEAAAVDALLPLFAAEREASRRDGLDEGAAALQEVIDRDRAQFPHSRSQSRIALGGARQILLGLLDDHARADATGEQQ